GPLAWEIPCAACAAIKKKREGQKDRRKEGWKEGKKEDGRKRKKGNSSRAKRSKFMLLAFLLPSFPSFFLSFL
ncbi:hypothetical protein, partial [Salmonella enterica]|uniref:hypothetical protein n=1 Tax=Salmonella enterica TaxID=28901 RepID=UPI003CEA57CC